MRLSEQRVRVIAGRLGSDSFAFCHAVGEFLIVNVDGFHPGDQVVVEQSVWPHVLERYKARKTCAAVDALAEYLSLRRSVLAIVIDRLIVCKAARFL
eukprot:6204818-Pleurochrysis_carterae.AAC.4